jgi:hypothetical protein
MNVDTAWIALPLEPCRVYAKRADHGTEVELGARPGKDWQFVGWASRGTLLETFRRDCAAALGHVEMAVTAALQEGYDSPYGLATSGISSTRRVYEACAAMRQRRKVVEIPMFEPAVRVHRHLVMEPKVVLALAEAM